MSEAVKEKDLKVLFKATVENLTACMKDGSATPKDKEIAIKLMETNQIGIELEQGEHVDALDNPLPFDEMDAN